MQDKMSLVLRQKGKTSDERLFELKAGRELHITHQAPNNKKSFAISILAMADQGKRVTQYKRRWLMLGIATVLVMLGFPEAGKHLPADLNPYILHILAGLFFTALLCFMLLVNSFSRHYVFYSVHTYLPLVVFLINKPSRKEFQQFIATLESNIKQRKQEMKITYDKQLAGELRTLRRVTEAGMLSESVYYAAKAKLLLMSDVSYQAPADRE